MIFTEALSATFESNQRVRRARWHSSVHVLIDDEKLCLRGHHSNGPDDGKNHPWIITSEDYFATDWEVVE